MQYFQGYYFKHQKNGQTISFIPGLSKGGAFLQVITPESSYFFPVSSDGFQNLQNGFRMGNCRFSTSGTEISLPGIYGSLRYEALHPLRFDIMGPFRYFPMECRHEIVSMRHRLHGELTVYGKQYDFNDGIGYIEGDRGRSFPKRYLWIHANDFADGSSATISVATIPFCGLSFTGAFAVLMFHGREYRFATYLGVRIHKKRNLIAFRQGSYSLLVKIKQRGSGFALAAPNNGQMKGIIKENNNAEIVFRLYHKARLLCSLTSMHAGFEQYP